MSSGSVMSAMSEEPQFTQRYTLRKTGLSGACMDWDAIGAIGEVVGALAVVATLGYLAKQVVTEQRVSDS